MPGSAAEGALEVVADALGLGYLNRERDEPDAAPDRVVGALHRGLVVRREPDLRDRDEVEELAVKEPGGDRVAAGQRLDEVLVEATARLNLSGGDEPGAAEPGDVVRDASALVTRHEGLGRGVQPVVAENAPESRDERRLPVRAGAVEDEEGLLVGESGERVPDGAAKEAPEVFVRDDPVEELVESGRRRGRVVDDGGKLRDEVGPIVRAEDAAP